MCGVRVTDRVNKVPFRDGAIEKNYYYENEFRRYVGVTRPRPNLAR